MRFRLEVFFLIFTALIVSIGGDARADVDSTGDLACFTDAIRVTIAKRVVTGMREQNHLSIPSFSSSLTQAAQVIAEANARRNEPMHEDDKGRGPAVRSKEKGYQGLVQEIVERQVITGACSHFDESSAVDLLMRMISISPSHQEILMNPLSKDFGIGVTVNREITSSDRTQCQDTVSISIIFGY